MSKEISVPFTEKEIEQAFMLQLIGPNKTLLAEAIISLLDEEWKQILLMKAIMGSKPVCKLTLFDYYMVKETNLNNYQINTQKSLNAGLTNTNTEFKVKLVKFNPFAYAKYVVQYEYMNSSDKKIVGESHVYHTHLKICEEFPEDLDLPF